MKSLLKKIIKKTPLYDLQQKCVSKMHERKQFIEWERKGRPAPPPHIVKQRAIRSFAKRFGLKILVEKDFVCLTGRDDEDESDMYPHPEADSGVC